MISLLGKKLTWIITSIIGLVGGIGAFIINKSASAETVTKSGWLGPFWPPHHNPPPAVPEVNTGWVLLPFVLAILFFASRHLLQRRGLGSR